MAETLILVPTIMGLLRKIPDAVQGADDVKHVLRERYKDYASMLAPLESNPELAAAKGLTPELLRLKELFAQVTHLLNKFTASPGDDRATKFKIVATRLAAHTDLLAELEVIDTEITRNLAIISSKGATRTLELAALRTLDLRVEFLAVELAKILPRSPVNLARIPRGTPPLPDHHVDRVLMLEALVRELTSVDGANALHVLAGISGGGKSVLASAVVRNLRVREHFRGGISWVWAGRLGKKCLRTILWQLSAELGVAPEEGLCPDDLGIEDLLVLLSGIAADVRSPRLVVLDDAWGAEVVDALRQTRLTTLVTTRDEGILGSLAGEWNEVSCMDPEEATHVLLRASGCAGSPGADVEGAVMKVAEDCGLVPLALSVAGSMRVVQGSTPRLRPWQDLHATLQDADESHGVGEQGHLAKQKAKDRLRAVVEASFKALSKSKREKLWMLAVLAEGTASPLELLRNLWDISDIEGAETQAHHFVSRSLLQGYERSYQVHDVVLDLARTMIQDHHSVLQTASSRQSKYLGRLNVLLEITARGTSDVGFYVLDRMWQAVEDLSRDPHLWVHTYHISLRELERGSDSQQGQHLCFWVVARVCELQGRHEDALSLYRRAVSIAEATMSPSDPELGAMILGVEAFVESQGLKRTADQEGSPPTIR